jgi:hypothetical protein
MQKMSSAREQIISTVKSKCAYKQDVFHNTISVFQNFRKHIHTLYDDVQSNACPSDERIHADYADIGEFETHLRIAGDVLVFQMHTNVFQFDKSHVVWQSSYVRENENRAYCGIINVYNFLNDSIKYHRENDLGYLVARIFVNKENHFLIEGKRQLNVLYNDYANIFDEKTMAEVLDSIVLFTLNFDLYVPPYDQIQEVTVGEMKQFSDALQIKTGKRLGFKFSFDQE